MGFRKVIYAVAGSFTVIVRRIWDGNIMLVDDRFYVWHTAIAYFYVVSIKKYV